MPFLSPAKLVVILVVALIVLGPDKLPGMARQVGSFWSQFRTFRQRFEDDVRGNFPDLPSTEKITQAVRSPLSFLDTLADAHLTENEAAAPADGMAEPVGDAVQPATTANRPAGTVASTEESTLPGVTVRDPQGTARLDGIHRVRSGGPVAPDDPSLN